ncbi:MAG TPA: integrin alpha [Planctomycetota bacterium]
MPLLDVNDQLGRSVTNLGDLDGNGVIDLACGALGDDDGGLDQGAAYILFLRGDGKVLRHQKISALAGNFTGDLDDSDQFGRDLNGIGDLDGDGIPDLAVGANYDDDGGINKGAIWILFLNRDGTVRQHQKISSTQGGFTGVLRSNDEFGRSVVMLGDLDGDGLKELAVGAPLDSTSGAKMGAIWILSLRPDGTVARHVKIGQNQGGFTGRLRATDWFSFSLAALGDLDQDGVDDLLVGAALDDDGAVNAGAVWILFLNTNGTVKGHSKISNVHGGFTAGLLSPFQFGTSVAALGDLNGDGITEIAVGAVKDGDVGSQRGAVYVIFLTPQGTVGSYQKLSQLYGGLPLRTLDNWDWYGSALAPLGDFDKDGVPDVAIGARNDDDGGANKGAVYVTFLRGGSTALTASSTAGNGLGTSADGTGLERGASVAWTAHGIGAEPDGSLQLPGEDLTSSELVFRLPRPAALAGRGAVVRLLVAASTPGAETLPTPSGLLLDPEALLGRLERTVEPGSGPLELRVRLPRRTEGTATLRFQALWLADAARFPTDALELRREP